MIGEIMADRHDWRDLRRHAGRWIAWNRQQTHIVATGQTFGAVKAAAAANGEHSVLVAQVPTEYNSQTRSSQWLHVFAVFIALAQPLEIQSTQELNSFRPAEESLRDDVESIDDRPTV
jgi:hypothetical protein